MDSFFSVSGVSSALVGQHTFFFLEQNLLKRKIASAFQLPDSLVGDGIADSC